MAKYHVLPDDPDHLKAAFEDLGLSEIKGKLHEPRVLEMFKLAGFSGIKDDETAWCAAAVGAWLVKAGLPPSGSLMARSYEKYGSKIDVNGKIPRGAILVWGRGQRPYGHVNLCLEDRGDLIVCIGGNQENGKGGGVTVTRYYTRPEAARLPPNMVAAPKPKPRPKPKPELEPLPPPPDIEPNDRGVTDEVTPAPTEQGLFRRLLNWFSATSVGGFIMYWKWEIVAVLCGFSIVLIVIAIRVIGVERIRERAREWWDHYFKLKRKGQ